MNPDQLQELLSPDYMIKAILEVHRFIRLHIRRFPPEVAFKTYFVKTKKGLKPLAAVDLLAERLFMNRIGAKFGKDTVGIWGEEFLDEGIDLRSEMRICILIDMIDGTDLLRRNFSNWCSAIVVFNPEIVEIEGAFVALPSDSLYFATKTSPASKVLLRESKADRPMPLKGPAKERDLKHAGVCLYGQKAASFLELLAINRREKFIEWLKEIAKSDEAFRFYNLAGNPMMVRLAEGTVDVVFDLKGQAPHDVVPGAFIAMKSEAVLGKITEEGQIIKDEFSLSDLAVKLLQPGDSKICYALTANRNILKEMSQLFSPEN